AQVNAALNTKRKVYQDTIQTIDLDKNEAINFEVTIRDALELQLLKERPRPFAYFILPEEKAIIDRLKILGIDLLLLEEEKEFEVQSYTVTEYEKEAKKYEGVNRQTVNTKLKSINKSFPKGTAVVKMNQSNANMAMEVLEPEVKNSFITFEVIKTEQGAELPIYRLVKTDPSLR
ncbi:MAG: peptidase, partial [Vicingaceae bacterium]